MAGEFQSSCPFLDESKGLFCRKIPRRPWRGHRARPSDPLWYETRQEKRVVYVLLPGDIQRKASGRTILKPIGKRPKIRFLKNPSMSRCILREGAYLYLSGLEVPKGNFSTGRRGDFLRGIFLLGDVK